MRTCPRVLIGSSPPACLPLTLFSMGISAPRRACWSCCIALSVLGLLLVASLHPAPATAQSVPIDTADWSDLQTRKLFVQGLTQSYLEDHDEAVSLFEKALDQTPHHPAILSALSEAEAARGNQTSAIYYARQARTHAPDSAYYHFELGRLLEEANRTEEALSAYRTLVSRFPTHTDGRTALARLLKAQNQPGQALQQYEALAEASEKVSPEIYHEMAKLYRETNDEDGLERTLQKLIQRSDRPLYRRLLGRLYTKQGRYKEAISLFEPLLEETPNDPRLLSQLKMLYTETGQPEKVQTLGQRRDVDLTSPDQLVARSRSTYRRASPLSDSAARAIQDMLQTALDQAPQHLAALDLLGRVYAEQGRHAEAGRTFARALDVNPRSADRWRRAASAYLQADSVARAATLADEGVLLFPGRFDLARIEGEARLRMNAYDRARDRFEAALSHMDTTTVSVQERAAVHTGLGRALHHLGATAQADSAYRTALQRDATHVPALTHYARHLVPRDDQRDRAHRLAQRAVKHAPSSPDALGTLAWTHARLGRPDEALRTFDRALKAGVPDAWVYERLGDLHHRLGNERRARRYWTQALDRDSTRDSVREKLQSIPQS